VRDQQPKVRLRQAVLAAADLERTAAALKESLHLGEPFHDPSVGVFGLANAVFALRECFLEVVSPVQADTAAGRHMARRGGDCGYMAIFDLEDLAGARLRAAQLGVRTAWELDLPDISTTHLHPADIQGTIVSLDQSRPYGTWRWGGPDWTGQTGTGAAARLAGVTIAVPEPDVVAARWGEVLGVRVKRGSQPALDLDDAAVRFTTPTDGREGLIEIVVELPSPEPACGSLSAPIPTIELGTVRVCTTERARRASI
jgi:hypothetical protein